MLEYIPWLCVLLLTYILYDWNRRQPRITDLSRRYVLVTGCDSGFGHQLVYRLDQLGCKVFAGCLSDDGQTNVQKRCTSNVTTFLLDVAKTESVAAALLFVERSMPPGKGLWGLVNNAGIPGVGAGPLEWLTLDDYRRTLEVNTLGAIDVTMSFLPLVKRAKGRIINMCSTGGRLAGPLALPYDVSQHAIEAFSDGLRRHLQLCQAGVTVHVIEPGSFRTCAFNAQQQQNRLAETWARLPVMDKKAYGQQFYQEYVQRCTSVLNNMGSPAVHRVVDAYVHALSAHRPRLRYTVGYDAQLFSIPLSYLPSAFVDWLMRKLHPRLPMPYHQNNLLHLCKS